MNENKERRKERKKERKKEERKKESKIYPLNLYTCLEPFVSPSICEGPLVLNELAVEAKRLIPRTEDIFESERPCIFLGKILVNSWSWLGFCCCVDMLMIEPEI